MTEPPPSFARRAASVGVGLFALWQLAFLPAANLIDFVPRRPGPHGPDPLTDPYQERGAFTTVEPLQRSAEAIGDVLDFWSELTGQEQGWSLFAPGHPPHSLFQAVELRFPDGTAAEVRSRFEPADLANPPPRWPLVYDRPFNFEAQFTTPGMHCGAEALARFPEAWARELPASVRDNQRLIRAWLRWHVKQFAAAHPERGPPTDVILKHRYIPTPLPGEARGWTKPVVERPYARWTPAGDTLDAYDPVVGRFVPLPPEGGR